MPWFCVIIERQELGKRVIGWESGANMKKTKEYENEPKTSENGKKRWTAEEIKTEILSWIKLILIILICTFLLRRYVIVNAEVPSSSMENLIEPGDRLVGFRMAYLKEEPKRFDVIIFRYPVDESQSFIKRVIGLPGETVEIREGRIYIDGASEPLEEDYLKEEWTVNNDGYVFQVPDDSYLVLGDNRNVSLDARYWADEAMEYGVAATESEAEKYSYVSRDAVLGKAEFKYWPKVGWIR